jgi:chemotaxis signal transduction protein
MSSRKSKAPPELTADELEILEVRRERLRQKPEASADDEATFWVAEFPVGDERYAVPLQRLRGSVPLKLVTPVPLSPPHVVGILRFQGNVIAALSLAVLLGGRGWRQDPAVLLVLEGPSGDLVALDCEQVPQPLAVPLRVVEEARSRDTSTIVPVSLPGARTSSRSPPTWRMPSSSRWTRSTSAPRRTRRRRPARSPTWPGRWSGCRPRWPGSRRRRPTRRPPGRRRPRRSRASGGWGRPRSGR